MGRINLISDGLGEGGVEKWKIAGETAFQDNVFYGPSSSKQENLVEAVRFAGRKETVLASFLERSAFNAAMVETRIPAPNSPETHRFEGTTRTLAMYYRDGDVWRVAFDDTPDPLENLLLARVEDASAFHKKDGLWILPREDPGIRRGLERAADEKRIVDRVSQAAEIQRRMHLDTRSNDPHGFRNNRFIRALLGGYSDMSADYLLKCGRGHAFMIAYTPDDLSSFRINDNVLVTPVSMGHMSQYDSMNFISLFYQNGVALHVSNPHHWKTYQAVKEFVP